MLAERSFLLVVVLSTASARYQDIVDLLNCEDDSCGDACDKRWLTYTTAETATEQPYTASSTAATDPVTAKPTKPPATAPPLPPNGCPDPTYQVPILQAASAQTTTHYWTAANVRSQLNLMIRGAARFVLQSEDASGCLIQNDKLAIFKDKCGEWDKCTEQICMVPVKRKGYWNYQLQPRRPSDQCADGTIIGYAISDYSCCGARSPMYEMSRDKITIPDLFYTHNEDVKNQWSRVDTVYDGVKNYYTQDIPFFLFGSKGYTAPECPDSDFMAPLVSCWSDDKNKLNHFFFLLSDVADWRPYYRQKNYRLGLTWYMGCVVRKDREEKLLATCDKTCMKPLCRQEWNDQSTGNFVSRLQPGDWNLPGYCGDAKHLGFIPVVEGCCGALTRLYAVTSVRHRLPGFYYTSGLGEYQQITATGLEWKDYGEQFYVWPTRPAKAV